MAPEFLQLALSYFGALVIILAITPMVGAGILVAGLQKARLPAIPYTRCLTAYYYAAFAAFLMILGASFLSLEPSHARSLRLGINLAVQLALVATQLRLFTPPRAFLVTAAAVFLANLVNVALLEGFFAATSPETSTGR